MKKIWIYLRPFLKLKFIISYLIPFAIVNGWAWVGSSLFAIGWVNWFTVAAVTWLGILWLPWTPEKLITIPVAIWIHTRLFRNDTATRIQLDALHAEAIKDWSRIKSWIKRNKRSGEDNGKGLSEAKSTQHKEGESSNENE